MPKEGKRMPGRPAGSGSSPPVPLVDGEYMDMLREYKRDEKKKRKLETPPPAPLLAPSSAMASKSAQADTNNRIESRVSASASDASDPESDLDSDGFEDVEIDATDEDRDFRDDEDELVSADDNDGARTRGVTISLDENQANAISRTPRSRRSELSKAGRITLHKISLTAWMLHSRMRSQWLNSAESRNSPVLRNLLSFQSTRDLFPPDHLTDFLKSKRFINGLRTAMEEWKLKFRVTRAGLASSEDDKGDPSNRETFFAALNGLHGSADMLGQGYFALLRSLGIRARLVCSLQPPDNLGSGAMPTLRTTRSEAPIFWAEAWDKWAPGWVAVDPLTSTVRLPIGSKPHTPIEPVANDQLNVLRYAIAWEEGSARDVTRRYSSHFNARTRKKRLPYFGCEEWLDRLMAMFICRRYSMEDVAELKELRRYTLREGIPKRLQDFVGHPEYALSDKLHYNELLRPGAVACGTLSNKGKAPSYIYRRKDVLSAHSAQSWYRKGMSIKAGLQPVLRRQRKNRLTGEQETVGLYTEDQTEIYLPPPVDEDGIVPKSQYKTIDIFTDTMIPAGAVYIRDDLGAEAAKILRIDYANAVTAVEYGKRGPQSKYFGVVVSESNGPSVKLVIQGLREIRECDAAKTEEARILALWRRYIAGIQIWDRVERMNPQVDAQAKDEKHIKIELSEASDSSDSSDSQSENFEKGEVINLGLGSPRNPKIDDAPTVVNDTLNEDSPTSRDAPEPPRKGRALKLNEYGTARIAGSSNQDRYGLGEREAVFSSPGFSSGNVDADRLAGSPNTTHSSFSDLDVDEISESELL